MRGAGARGGHAVGHDACALVRYTSTAGDAVRRVFPARLAALKSQSRVCHGDRGRKRGTLGGSPGFNGTCIKHWEAQWDTHLCFHVKRRVELNPGIR